MKRPFEHLTELSLEAVKKTAENSKFYFNQFDQILVWIVGFSITAISIIVSDFTSISGVLSKTILSLIVILFGISIIFGIIYRFAALLSMKKQHQIMFYIEAAFSKDEMINVVEEDIISNDIYEANQKILLDFNYDYSDIVNLYNEADNEQRREYLLKYLNDEHKRLSKWAKDEYDYTLKFIKSTFKNAFDIEHNRVEKMFQGKDNDATWLKIYEFITVLSLTISVISFFLVIVILILNYIKII